MKFRNLGSAVVAASLLIAAPGFAQSTSPSPAKTTPTAQKQKTDGADDPSNPREYQGAAEWHKQHTQSLSHAGGATAQKQKTQGVPSSLANPRYGGAYSGQKQQ
jgi:hypothetical protein